jgi:hypothetical protein
MRADARLCGLLVSALAALSTSTCTPARSSSDGAQRARVVPVATSTATAPIASNDADDAARGRVLDALDAGDLDGALGALATIGRSPVTEAFERAIRGVRGEGSARTAAFANVRPIRVATLPSRAPSVDGAKADVGKPPAVPTIPAKRIASARGTQLAIENRGSFFTDGMGRPDPSTPPPAFLPARIGDSPLRFMRACDGRFVAIYRERFVAVVAADGSPVALLDLEAWATPGPRPWLPQIVDVELDRDLLYITLASDAPFVAAIEIATGAVRWRADGPTAATRLAVVTDGVLAYRLRRGTSASDAGEIVLLDRKTGATKARRSTPEIEGGADAIFAVGDGVVATYASSELYGSTGLRHDERLDLRVAAKPRPPLPDPPKTIAPATRIAGAQAKDTASVRLAAWRELARDPRAAFLSLRRYASIDPTGFAASVLFDAAESELVAARARAEKTLASMKPTVVPNDKPSGPAPIARRGARTLKIVGRRTLKEEDFAGAFGFEDDADVPPAWVPEKLLGRRLNQDASEPEPDARIDVYSEPYQHALVVPWRDGRARSVLELDADVRFAAISGDVVLLTLLRNGMFSLDARDATTGRTYWMLPYVVDRAFVVVDGYIVVGSATGPDLLLVEADTGRTVMTVPVGRGRSGAVELVVRRRGKLLALVEMDLVEVSLD